MNTIVAKARRGEIHAADTVVFRHMLHLLQRNTLADTLLVEQVVLLLTTVDSATSRMLDLLAADENQKSVA